MDRTKSFPELDAAYAYFLSVKDEYLLEHHGKFLLVHGDKVHVAASSFEDADERAFQLGFEPGSYVIQQLLEEGEAPTICFEVHT